MGKFNFKIGGIGVSLVDSGLNLSEIQGKYKQFKSSSQPLALYKLRPMIPDIPAGNRIFQSDSWALYENGKNIVLRCAFSDKRDPTVRTALLKPDFLRGNIYCDLKNKALSYDPFSYPLDELLFMHILGRGRGMLVHSCGLEFKGEGLLFAGASGRGKSTLSRLWDKPARVLSDEKNVVRILTDQPWIYGTPWHGDAGRALNARAPLKKILFLEHGKKNRLQKLSGFQAVQRLLVCSFIPWWDKQSVKFTLGFCHRLFSKVEAYRLWFTPDVKAVEFIKKYVVN
jgi:hypothetical protein